MRTRIKLRLAPVLFALCLVGCGASEPQGSPAPARQKLVDLEQGVLHLPANERIEALELINTNGSEGFENWKLVGDVGDPMGGAKGLIKRRIDRQDAGEVLTLSGQSGLIYCIIPAEPNAFYSFSADVRVKDIASTSDKYFGSTPWIAEMTIAGSVEEFFEGQWMKNIYHREQFPTARGTSEWHERVRIFGTGPDTRTLLVTMSLATEGKVKSGEVSFRSVSLEQVDKAVYLEARLAWAVGVRAAGDEPHAGWRSKRLVRGNLFGEQRPSIVLLPGESLSFRLRLPEGKPRFEAGVGFWDPSLARGGMAKQRFKVSVRAPNFSMDKTLLSEASGDRSRTQWQDLNLDLSLAAGQEVDLILQLEGDLPGMFGAPQIVAANGGDQMPNVVLISIDTLRADHVGAYGADQNQTPRIDAFAEQGILFAKMVAQAPYTLPGHATIFSGQHPGVHGLQEPGHVLSNLRSPVLTRILSRQGYATQAFTGGGYVNADFGFARDFDGFVNLDPWKHRTSHSFRDMINRTPPPIKRVSTRADQGLYVTQEMVDTHDQEGVKRWVTAHKDEPFFLFVHTFAIHDYEPPAGYLRCAEKGCSSKKKDYSDFKLKKGSEFGGHEISDADKEHLKHRYDATLRYTDQCFGDLIDHLDALGIADETIVILTTDHGEEMFERGFIQHGKTLYEELTNVPLIMRIPGVEPQVISHPAMQVDILPTLLSALGMPRDARIQGIDLLSEASAGRATWSEIADAFVEVYTYRSGDGWKLIYTPMDPTRKFRLREEWQLFNLDEDPGEQTNLVHKEPLRFAELKTQLELQREKHASLLAQHADVEVGIDQSTKDALKQLGYVGEDEE